MYKLSRFKNKEIATTITFVKNDEGDRDLPEKYHKPLLDLFDKLHVKDDVYVFETSHGFIAEATLKSTLYKYIQLSPQELKQIDSIKGLRYIRCTNNSISIHLE